MNNGLPPPPLIPPAFNQTSAAPTSATVNPNLPLPPFNGGVAFSGMPQTLAGNVPMRPVGFPQMMNSSLLNAIADPKMLAAMSTMFLTRPPAQVNVPANGLGSQGQSSQTESSESLKEDDLAWKEFKTTEGRIFWHNSKTNKSTWDKPDELKSDLERILATSTMWREYPGGDGKTYWHNLETKQSEWEVPKEVADIIERINALAKEDWSGRKFDGKTQAKTVFREFLSAKGIGYAAKWDDIGKILQKDPKWKTFDSYLTTGERKHALNEYVDQLQKKTREEQRLRKARARDSLADFLNRWKEGETGPPMQPDSTFEDLRSKAHNEEWWHCLSLRDQAEAFEEAAQQVMLSVLHKTPRSVIEQWVKFYSAFIGEGIDMDATPESIVEFSTSFLPSDQLTAVHSTVLMNAWSQAVRAKLDSAREEAEGNRFRREVLNRKAFFAVLKTAEKEGMLNAKTEWVDFINGPCPKKQRLEDEEVLPPYSETDAKLIDKVQKRVREWVHSDGQNGSNGPPPDTPNGEDGAAFQGKVDTESNRSKEDSVQPDGETKSARVCEDIRYLRLFLQGGSTPRELFDEFVYELWDTYEQVRGVLKDSITLESELGQKLTQSVPPSWEEVVAAVREAELVPLPLLEKANRAGIFIPLISSLAKRLKKSTKNSSGESRLSMDRDRDMEDEGAVPECEEEREEGQLRTRPGSRAQRQD